MESQLPVQQNGSPSHTAAAHGEQVVGMGLPGLHTWWHGRGRLRNSSKTALRWGRKTSVSAGEMRKRVPSGPLASVSSLTWVKPSELGQVMPPPRELLLLSS